ncbi:indole-3-glycerol phosphate synthase TrpC [Virgibacillus halophilus]|uniref:indole-3-glycerol-phosphate synthase n=1 Tax=Tigheibacillus halophilus TaxID=361280 RepID=A0ABU5C7H2_9BACI|nr:indole-3-glycerol phosphate synthase TrpC [Virgibacillus halophilus]
MIRLHRPKKYEAFGAGAISVLTDQVFFKGSMQDLRAIRAAVDLPILCKDFIIDPIQIDYAKANGANIILLIAAALSKDQFTTLYQYAKTQGLEVLCEVHQLEELDIVLQQRAPIIGINNRNLHHFRVDLAVTEKILPHIKGKASVIISESGIRTADHAKAVAGYGANAILVGESFVRAKNLAATFADFQIALKAEGTEHVR